MDAIDGHRRFPFVVFVVPRFPPIHPGTIPPLQLHRRRSTAPLPPPTIRRQQILPPLPARHHPRLPPPSRLDPLSRRLDATRERRRRPRRPSRSRLQSPPRLPHLHGLCRQIRQSLPSSRPPLLGRRTNRRFRLSIRVDVGFLSRGNHSPHVSHRHGHLPGTFLSDRARVRCLPRSETVDGHGGRAGLVLRSLGGFVGRRKKKSDGWVETRREMERRIGLREGRLDGRSEFWTGLFDRDEDDVVGAVSSRTGGDEFVFGEGRRRERRRGCHGDIVDNDNDNNNDDDDDNNTAELDRAPVARRLRRSNPRRRHVGVVLRIVAGDVARADARGLSSRRRRRSSFGTEASSNSRSFQTNNGGHPGNPFRHRFRRTQPPPPPPPPSTTRPLN
mmetsp:Transcript_24363/g.50999  ORF Transcript_24363/g.50999 Transcript_24363/m.50999 type:complete len:388 (-) Transcript_24363:2514-3677(-)